METFKDKTQAIIAYVNQIPGLACLKNRESTILACSPQFTHLIGYESPDKTHGITDYDMRCGAVSGADKFIAQDKDALNRGENRSVNVYTYSDGNKTVMYGHKTPLVLDGDMIGLNVIAQNLTHSNNIANKFIMLLENDSHFLSIKNKKAATYVFQDTYADDLLSKKESMCLFYIVRGKSNKEIAQILNLSCRTIEGKIITIKGKMQCDSRNQIIEKALQKGYLEIIINQLFSNDNFSLNLN